LFFLYIEKERDRAVWETVYLQRSPTGITSDQIRKAISPGDWLTLGEDFGLDEYVVDRFMEDLRWGDVPLWFGQENQRPVKFHFWTAPERVREELDELRSPPPSVHERL
jgi:hypothetical protein